MELKKRDCDIKIKLTPSGSKYLHFEMDVQGDRFDFLPSSALGEQFGAFVSALYYLFYENDDCHNEWSLHEHHSDENHVIDTVTAKVEWDNEGDVIEIAMSRKFMYDIDWENDQLHIEIRNYGKVLKNYTVKTKDFCYAVAKACTEVLKEYGFYGYRYSTEHDCFNLHQLLYIKSVALGNFEARKMFTVDGDLIKRTSFADEMELLAFDM